MATFQHHPDGLIIIKSGANTYMDTVANFKTDANDAAYAIPSGYTERFYEPGVRHFLFAGSSAEPQDLTWSSGDTYIANVATYIANKADREKELYTKLVLSSNGTADFDGVKYVNADNSATHTITIKKQNQDNQDVTTGSEAIRIFLSCPMSISNSNPSLTNGSVTITVGPSDKICDCVVSAADPAGALRSGNVTARFK
jgi:hypothetical protein